VCYFSRFKKPFLTNRALNHLLSETIMAFRLKHSKKLKYKKMTLYLQAFKCREQHYNFIIAVISAIRYAQKIEMTDGCKLDVKIFE
jgi:hypothetical protein